MAYRECSDVVLRGDVGIGEDAGVLPEELGLRCDVALKVERAVDGGVSKVGLVVVGD